MRFSALASASASVALACSLAALAGASSSQAAAGGSQVRYARVRHACHAPAAHHASCFALFRVPAAASEAAGAGVQTYALNDGAASSGPAGGLTPAQLAGAYGYDQASGGSGQTVAIVDAFDDPKIESDLAEFDNQYKLPACTAADGCLSKVGQSGSATELPKPDKSGWSAEISLDVETVHGACPKCKILLVETNSESFADLAAGVDEAVALGATEVSNSYGGPESELGSTERAAYTHPGVVIAASSGDDGYDDWDFINEGFATAGMPEAPASLPSVVAVGGTSLHLTTSGARASETVWNNNGAGDKKGRLNEFAEGASGGGCSTLFTAQPWQRDMLGFEATGCAGKRLVADVSAVADPLTGFDVYDTDACGTYCTREGFGKGWVTVGGTSLSSPLITSLYALTGGSGGSSFPALTLYAREAAPSLYDVSEGANGYCDGLALTRCGEPNATFGRVDCEGTTACNAAPGFDGPSGVGAPAGLEAFRPRLPAAAIAPPGPLTSGTESSFSGAASSDPYPGGSVVGYAWNWGDGSAAGSGPAPAHTYARPGTYVVTLTVSDNYGLTGSASTTVQVSTVAEQEAATNAREREARQAAEERQRAQAAASAREQEKSLLSANLPAAAALRPAVKPRSPSVTLARSSLVASSSGTVVVRVACPAGVGSCEGRMTLRTLGAVGTASRTTAKPAALTLAAGSFTAGAGKVKAVRLHLSARARRLLAHARRLRVRTTTVAHDPAGESATTRALATLLAAEAARARR